MSMRSKMPIGGFTAMATSIHHILAICSGREKDGEKARDLHDHRRRNTTNLPNHCHLAVLADDAWDGAATANKERE